MADEQLGDPADLDPRWNFEKTVTVPVKEDTHKTNYNWDRILDTFNYIQEEHGDLYMVVTKLPTPTTWEKLKLRYRNRKTQGTDVTFQHEQVYDWYMRIANELGVSVGEAVHKTLFNINELREEMDVGQTLNVDFIDVQDVEKKDSKVSKDELMTMLEEDEDDKDYGTHSPDENLESMKDNELPKKEDGGDKTD